MLQSKRQMTFGNLLFGLALLFLGFTFGYILIHFSDVTRSAESVAHTYEVKEYIERLSSDVKDAERAERSYLITDDESYLTLFYSAIQDEQNTSRILFKLLQNNPAQVRNMKQLSSLVDERLSFLVAVLQTHQREGLKASREIILTGKGKKLMMAIQAQVRAMLAVEDRLIVNRKQMSHQLNQQVYGLSTVFFVLALIPLILGYALLRASAARYKLLVLEKERTVTQLLQSNGELETVAAIASHDLKAPLRKINFFVAELLRDPGNSFSMESRDFLGRMQAATEKMQDLIEHVLVIARRKNAVPTHEIVNLGQLVEEVAYTLEGQLRDSGGSLKIGAMCSIQGDRYELAQLLQNLVENGIKYHRPGIPPVVSVWASQTDDGACEIRVKDNGLGVERQHQKEIFKMFSRAPNHVRCEGSGIGLGTVSRIVRRHHGSVRLESQPGQGSEFIVKLPVAQIAAS